MHRPKLISETAPPQPNYTLRGGLGATTKFPQMRPSLGMLSSLSNLKPDFEQHEIHPNSFLGPVKHIPTPRPSFPRKVHDENGTLNTMTSPDATVHLSKATAFQRNDDCSKVKKSSKKGIKKWEEVGSVLSSVVSEHLGKPPHKTIDLGNANHTEEGELLPPGVMKYSRGANIDDRRCQSEVGDMTLCLRSHMPISVPTHL